MKVFVVFFLMRVFIFCVFVSILNDKVSCFDFRPFLTSSVKFWTLGSLLSLQRKGSQVLSCLSVCKVCGFA